jgi:hypothetical protein
MEIPPGGAVSFAADFDSSSAFMISLVRETHPRPCGKAFLPEGVPGIEIQNFCSSTLPLDPMFLNLALTQILRSNCSMKYRPIFLCAVAIALSPAAHADLPMMKEKPWLGYFLGYKDRGARFLISSKGNTMFEPLKKDGTAIAVTNPVKLNFDIIETLPDGKTVRKKIDDDVFTSDSPASLDPKEPITIRGKVTGDATFEITVSEERGAISLTGRITDPGTNKNPLHLAISIDFLPYKHNGLETPEQQKNFEKKARRDEIRLELPMRERATLDFLDTMNPAKKAKDGFSSAEIRTEGYGGLRWQLTASEKSTLRFDDKGERPLWNGFTISWTSNPGTDPANEKFTIEHK